MQIERSSDQTARFHETGAVGTQRNDQMANGDATRSPTRRKIQRMQKTRRRIATDVANRRNTRKKNVKQPMETHEIPDRPWSRVSSDVFTLNSKEFVLLTDSYSDFIEVGELKGTTAVSIINFHKEQFSRHGIPEVVVTDNGPQYACREFTEFSREWEFKHVRSSPRHAKSNGKAESAVKVAKKIFKKAYRDNKDPWMALIDQRNTPTQGVNSNPVQRLMSRRTGTLLPMSTNLLYPRVEEGVKEKLKAKGQKAKSYYDRGSKSLPELEIGQEVRVAGQRNKIW